MPTDKIIRKKVLLLNPPGNKLYIRDYYSSLVSKLNYYWPPIDLQLFSAFLYGRHDIRVLDAIAERVNYAKAYKAVINMDIDTIIFLTGAVSWKEDFEFLAGIAARKKLNIIGSGDILLYAGRDLMKRYDFLDGISLDFTTADILSYLEGQGDGRKINNFIYRIGDAIISGDKTGPDEYSIPVPRHELFPLLKYSTPLSRRYPLTGIITDFGCSFNCTFCPYANIRFRTRNIENVREELRYISKLKIKELVFRNQTFTVPRQKAYELCSMMVSEKFGFSWMAISRVNAVDKELLAIMKKAGCHSLIFGVETQNDEVLKKYNKMITAEDSKRAFRLCREAGINPSAYIIIGLPGESKESIFESIKFVKELDAEYVSFSIATPRIGTKFREEVISNNLVASDNLSGLDSSLSFPMMGTKELTAQEIWEIRNYAIRSFYLNFSFIFRRLCRVSSFRDLRSIFSEGVYFCKNYYRSLFGGRRLEKGQSKDDYCADAI
ncbi:MAG: radical SAM protein [Candidatus Omnitrophota bacterium]